MRKIIILIIAIFTINIAKAQWITQTSGSSTYLISVCFTDANTAYVVGFNGTILKTTNGGNTWSSQISGTTNALISVYFTDANTGYISGEQGTILKTINGGTTWIPQTSSATLNLRSICFVNNTVYIIGDDGEMIKTTNGGTTWTTVYPWSSSYNLYSICFINSNIGFIAANKTINTTKNAKIFKTINGGASWTTIFSDTSYLLNSMCIADSNSVYVSGWDGKILKTTNRGSSWSKINCEIMKGIGSIYFTSPDIGYVVGSDTNNNGIIMKTIDGGASWFTQYVVNTNPLNYICFFNSNKGYALGNNGIILNTTNGGGLGVTEFNDDKQDFKIYPNPTIDILTIETNNKTEQKLEIINLIGQTIYNSVINKKTTINTSAFAKGVYIIKLSSDKETVVKKIVKE